MKKTIIFQKLMIFVACCLVVAGCQNEETNFSDPESNITEDIGYLDLSSMNVFVDLDSEIVSKADDSTIQQAPDDYVVSVYKELELVYTSSYAEAKNTSEAIALTSGTYDITVVSSESEQECGWDIPYYTITKSVSVIKDATTEIGDLTCTLSNIKTSVSFSSETYEMFQADAEASTPLTVNVSLGNTSLDYYRGEDRYGYFQAVEESNTLTFSLSGMYNTSAADEDPEYILVDDWQQVITDVQAGQWRKVTISIEGTNDGSVNFILDVETWIYDELIYVDVMSQSYMLEEESIVDPDSETSDPNGPVVSLSNDHDITESFVINANIFDFDAETCMDVIKANITPANGSTIASIDVTVSSENASLMTALEDIGLVDGSVAIYPTNQIEDYLTVRDDNDVIVATAKYSAMSALYEYSGTHTIKIKATDSQGRYSYTNLVVEVDNEANAPSIVWRAGYSFDDRHQISATTTLPVVLDISSSTGITGFMITITSDVLDENELSSLNLATEMDLINPATDEMEATLAELGFPVGAEVEGAKELEFDITSFMPVLAMLGTGNSDFTLEVSDASGTTTCTLMVESVN